MDLEDAQLLIEETRLKLEAEYFFLKDWNIVFDNAKRRAGVCKVITKEIGLSKEHVRANSIQTVLDTLLHEFAHAITFHLYNDIGHGKNWKSIAKKIGAIPKATGKFNLPDAPWALVVYCHHSNTIEKVALRYRKNKNIKSFFIKGRPSTRGKLFYVKAKEYNLFELGKIQLKQLEFIR
ncbi:SprT-like domain-containing protein [Aliikangiella sp. IMCC44359]|uniref:SprT-like domain-containing protein n=1 Tax=Aliikangiella sp. IMCC44359 TaxID=3459125 RepID=UPI00403B11CF